jgi:hypothetical protein
MKAVFESRDPGNGVTIQTHRAVYTGPDRRIRTRRIRTEDRRQEIRFSLDGDRRKSGGRRREDQPGFR